MATSTERRIEEICGEFDARIAQIGAQRAIREIAKALATAEEHNRAVSISPNLTDEQIRQLAIQAGFPKDIFQSLWDVYIPRLRRMLEIYHEQIMTCPDCGGHYTLDCIKCEVDDE